MEGQTVDGKIFRTVILNQSAGNIFFQYFLFIMNQHIQNGSSETLRKTLRHPPNTEFQFNAFYEKITCHVQNRPSQAFLEWFLGFFEGDGAWVTRQGDTTNPGRKEIYVSVGQKEKKVLSFVQTTFGFGSVRSKKSSNGQRYWYWCVYSKNNLDLLVSLFYGNLVLPSRQDAFLKWVSFGQTFQHFPHLNVDADARRSPQVSLNNSWLSGFTDAEGCFNAKIVPFKRDTARIRIEQRWIINQKNLSNKNRPIFEQIRTLFQTKSQIRVFYRHRKVKSTFIELSIGSVESQKILVDYFKRHPLQTKKHKAFVKWYHLYLYRTNTLPHSTLSDHQLKKKMQQTVRRLNR